MFLALTGVAAFIMPLIFLSFAVYHFVNWYKSLQILRRKATEEKTISSSTTTLHRVKERKYIAGVCRGIHLYYGFSVLIIRLVFILTAFIYVGVIAYILLWIFLPVEETKTQTL